MFHYTIRAMARRDTITNLASPRRYFTPRVHMSCVLPLMCGKSVRGAKTPDNVCGGWWKEEVQEEKWNFCLVTRREGEAKNGSKANMLCGSS